MPASSSKYHECNRLSCISAAAFGLLAFYELAMPEPIYYCDRHWQEHLAQILDLPRFYSAMVIKL